MSNKKLRFNFIDALILLAVLLVMLVAWYFFVLRDTGSDVSEVSYNTIEYVIEVSNIESRFDGTVKRDQSVEDAIRRKKIGKVAGVQTVPYEKITFNKIDGVETVSEVEGKITMAITIQAEAIETDQSFLVDGCEIKVGLEYSLMLPEFYGTGYCVEINVK